MLIDKKHLLFTICLLLISFFGISQQGKPIDLIEKNFFNPPESAKPWVFWYWMHGAVSKDGITADLEAMKEVGIGGAYLMPIQDTLSTIPFQPTVRQLTPGWWAMVKFAMQEAKRLNLKLAMHVSDGFALAGGPWITPELSMQKLVWTKTYFKWGDTGRVDLERPESYNGFYKDVAVFAYPANSVNAFANEVLIPTVTASNGAKPQFLSFVDPDNKESFKSDTACWVQYKYPIPFTCRTIRIHTGTNSYQAQRLIIQTSDDGINFKTVTRLEPPRHGWQDTGEDYTHSIPATTSRYFRFVYDKEGSEPGSEDLDAAKWKPSLKVMGIYLSDEPVINQYEAKNGSIWRVAANARTQQIHEEDAIRLKSIINLTNRMDNDGNLHWTPPAGDWVVVRIGHTSTGQTNATGGAAKGLECDKFNAAAVKLQFDNWFGKIFEKTDPVLAKEVLKIFHVDSWECGSQNWSNNFAAEFKKRRGYDLMPYLLVMTGVPVDNAAASEKILHDVRTTIAELVNDVFYVTLKKLSTEKGCKFSAESIAPTFVSDGLLHYKNVDIPMGEFWLNSPTHDKPNDMLDAISGAHIYGKNIIQAEAFTTLRMDWSEHPGGLKALGDRNFALGINKMVLHVFTHNPWMDKKPGMTLDGVGLYFQRDQTWFKQSKAWIEYLTRCQALLQMGKPVVDIGVFTGEEVPRRSVLPDRLVNVLPGIFGKEKVEAEKKRLENTGQPLRQISDGVTHSANMADPEDWIDPLNGYKYDCFNPDVLMQMKVVDGRVVTPGGASYAVLVIPGKHPMNPNGTMSVAVLNKLKQLANAGTKIIIGKDYISSFNGNKNVVAAPYTDSSFAKLGVQKDVEVIEGKNAAWTHRKAGNTDIYFISNQKNIDQHVNLRFNIKGRDFEIYDPVTGDRLKSYTFSIDNNNYIHCEFDLAANQSLVVVFKGKLPQNKMAPFIPPAFVENIKTLNSGWQIHLKKNDEQMVFKTDSLISLPDFKNDDVKYYSGTMIYENKFTYKPDSKLKSVSIQIDSIFNIATIVVNEINCGTLWTPPYSLDITKALKPDENKIEIEVTNTWHNRLIGDNLLPPDKRITWTTAPFRLKDKPLLPAGIIGDVKIIIR
jgi:hypothetical protein